MNGGGKATVFICAIIVVYILTIGIPVTSPTSSNEGFKRTVSILVPAVSQTKEGLKGVISNITVTVVKPGSGKVFVSASPLTEIDMQASARTAAIIASTILGENPLTINFYVSVESPSIIIGGPSAGAALTIAMVSAISGFKINRSVMITGMINPDGTIGPVGGVKEKLEAAARIGVKLFLVPIGQGIVQENIIEHKKIGPFIVRTIKPIRINLIEYGKELGVRVLEVSNIIDAVKYMLNIKLAEKPIEHVELKLPTEAESLFREQISEFKETYLNIKYTLGEVKGAIKDIVKEAENKYNEALKLSNEGYLYSAASMLFQALYLIDFARNLQKYFDEGEKLIQELFNEVNSTISKVSSRVYSAKQLKLSDIDILIASRYRIYLAKKILEQAAETYSKGKYEDTIFSLVYAKWRAKTAELWINALGLGVKEAPSEEIVQHLSTLFIYEANSIIAYASSLLKDLGVYSDEFLDKAVQDLSEAEEMNSMGDYYGSLGLSLSAIAEATVSIHKYFTVNTEKQLRAIKDIAEKSLKYVLSLGAEPLLSLGYYEFAHKQQEIFDKIYFFELSSLHAKVLIIADAIRSPGNITVKTVTPITPRTPGKTPTPTPSEEYELKDLLIRIAPILASFIGGILVGYSLKRRAVV